LTPTSTLRGHPHPHPHPNPHRFFFVTKIQRLTVSIFLRNGPAHHTNRSPTSRGHRSAHLALWIKATNALPPHRRWKSHRGAPDLRRQAKMCLTENVNRCRTCPLPVHEGERMTYATPFASHFLVPSVFGGVVWR
jgi:hypothetical protein